MTETITLTIRPETDQRLDRALAANLAEVSRRRLREWIDQGGVYVDGRRTRRQSLTLRGGQTYRIAVYPFHAGEIETLAAAIDWSARILYRDGEWLAVDKPAGIPSGATRQSARHHLSAFLERAGLLSTPHFIVHRLDRETTGVVVVALTRKAAAHLGNLLATERIDKRYLAVVGGIPEQGEWEVQGYLTAPEGPERPARLVMEEREGAAWSHSRFRLLDQDVEAGLALVEARPRTGRTHQIRAHLAHDRLPILGDWRYGQGGGELALHCREIVIPRRPPDEPLKIRASLPATMQSLVERYFQTALRTEQI